MNPILFNYEGYKKVLINDLNSLTESCMEASEYDDMVSNFLDQSKIPDSQILHTIKAELTMALEDGDFVKAFQLNAFLGYIKKTLSKNRIKNKKR